MLYQFMFVSCHLNPYVFRLGHLPKSLPHLLPEIVSETTTSNFYVF